MVTVVGVKSSSVSLSGACCSDESLPLPPRRSLLCMKVVERDSLALASTCSAVNGSFDAASSSDESDDADLNGRNSSCSA